MLFNYTTHFLVLYYFSSSSPPKVRGVREELKLFLFYFFISTFYISLKKKSDYPFMHLLYSQLLVCQRVCLQNTVCLICK